MALAPQKSEVLTNELLLPLPFVPTCLSSLHVLGPKCFCPGGADTAQPQKRGILPPTRLLGAVIAL